MLSEEKKLFFKRLFAIFFLWFFGGACLLFFFKDMCSLYFQLAMLPDEVDFPKASVVLWGCGGGLVILAVLITFEMIGSNIVKKYESFFNYITLFCIGGMVPSVIIVDWFVDDYLTERGYIECYKKSAKTLPSVSVIYVNSEKLCQ